MLKIIDLPLELPTNKIEETLKAYDYVHSYPINVRTSDGITQVIRYFVKEVPKTSKPTKKESK